MGMQHLYSKSSSSFVTKSILAFIGQKKACYRLRIPESICARKETVDIDIVVTSRNGDRKTIQPIRITSRPPSRKRKWNQFSHF